MSAFDSASFKRLQKKWYQRLKTAGFDDIERENEDLKHRFRIDTARSQDFESVADYYQAARDLVTSGKLSLYKPATIRAFTLHSQGKYNSEIAAQLKLSVSTVSNYIKTIQGNFNLIRKKD